MNNFHKIRRAEEFAEAAHFGQKDDNGKDYFKAHIIPVMEAVSCFTDNTDVICAAILHDVLEDTKTDIKEIVEQFGERVADLVLEITHQGEKDGYGYYFPRLKSAEGILIKLCDRASNISRMQSWNRHRRQHYLNKTKFWKDGSDIKDKMKLELSDKSKKELEDLKDKLDLPPIAEKIICKTPTDEFLRLEKESGNDIVARNSPSKEEAKKK